MKRTGLTHQIHNDVANVTQATDELNIYIAYLSMTTVVSNSAALVPACSGSPRSSEDLNHLLPFFSGFPCLVSTVHCPDGLRMNVMTSSGKGKQLVCGGLFMQGPAQILNVTPLLKRCQHC